MKKILLIILTFLASTSVVFGATNLWQFYNEQGLLLPSYEYRKDFYEQILAEDEYKGTVKQNDLYLQYLQGNDFVPAPKAEEIKLGASLPSATAVFETSLASPITSSATSLTLTANSVRGGGSLSGYNCFTIDEGATTAETVCGTVSSTAVSSLTRGISQANGTTTVSALQFAHRRGSNVKITDFPIIQILKAQNNGEDTFANVLHYATTTGSCLDGSDICNKSYIDATANAGAATSTETNGGIVELGTLAEQADSYDGGSSKPTVLQTKNSTSTCQVVGSYNIVASSTTGKLDKNCFDQSLNYAFSGANTHSGINSFSNSVGIGTTSPFTSLGVAGTITANTINATTTTATSTFSGNVVVSNNASTTNLTISGTCVGCLNGYELNSGTQALTTSSDGDTTKTVSCTGSKKVVGGGYDTAGDAYNAKNSYPSSNTAWTASVRCESAGLGTCNAGNLTVYAICVNP